MSEGMLGRLPLSETRGPRDELEDRLAGAKGEIWLAALKRFLREENPWANAKPAKPRATPRPARAQLRFKRIDANTLEVYNDVPSQLPFDTAERTWNVIRPSKVIFTRQGTGKDQILLRNGVQMTLHVDPAQLVEGGISGQVLWDEKLKAMPGHSSKNELDALKANPDFIPESWQGLYVFFWGEGFRYPGDTHECVDCLYWFGQQWYVGYYWLSCQWYGSYPAAVSASPAL